MEMHKEKLIITKWRYIKRISTIVSYARASYRVELERKSQNVSNYDKLIYICPYTGRKLYNMRKIQYRKANCAWKLRYFLWKPRTLEVERGPMGRTLIKNCWKLRNRICLLIGTGLWKASILETHFLHNCSWSLWLQ